jgi:hypothetical protein
MYFFYEIPWSSIVVDATVSSTKYLSLQVLLDGTPAISYDSNVGTDGVRMARNLTTNGLGVWTTIDVEIGITSGSYCTSKLASSGNPVILHGTPGNIRFSASNTNTGFGGWTTSRIGDFSNYQTLGVLFDGRLSYAYYNSFDGQYEFTRSPLQTTFLNTSATYILMWVTT